MTRPDRHGERGATAVVVVAVAALLFGVMALAIDVGHLYLVRGELQNAADACALRGAGTLYAEDGRSINPAANQEARDVGVANQSQKSAVEIDWSAGNSGDVERGHWNFYAHDGLAARTFTPNPADVGWDTLWGKTDEELDADPGFVNAVRCRAWRSNVPVVNFFAPVLNFFTGQANFASSIVGAEAVAIVGFAGTLEPNEIDQPIGLCADQITDEDGEYSCVIGRMLNNGNAEGTHETAMWSDFGQSELCSAASASEVRPLICANGNEEELVLGRNIDSVNGVQQSGFDAFDACWRTGLHRDTDDDGVDDATLDTDVPPDGLPDQPWPIDLPVLDCTAGTCTPLVGAVTVNVVWIVRDAKLSGTNSYDEAPAKMGSWTCSVPSPATGAERQQCWAEFVARFNLRNSDDNPAPYDSKSIYFVPDCTGHEPTGRTGGRNFGILAKYPALVR